MISQPDAGGHFVPYGGRYVPEILMAPIEELDTGIAARDDAGFQAELARPDAQLRRPADSAVFRQTP